MQIRLLEKKLRVTRLCNLFVDLCIAIRRKDLKAFFVYFSMIAANILLNNDLFLGGGVVSENGK